MFGSPISSYTFVYPIKKHCNGLYNGKNTYDTNILNEHEYTEIKEKISVKSGDNFSFLSVFSFLREYNINPYPNYLPNTFFNY